MKPKIKKFNPAWWVCVGNGITAFGMSIASAFKAWERTLKIYQNRFEHGI